MWPLSRPSRLQRVDTSNSTNLMDISIGDYRYRRRYRSLLWFHRTAPNLSARLCSAVRVTAPATGLPARWPPPCPTSPKSHIPRMSRRLGPRRQLQRTPTRIVPILVSSRCVMVSASPAACLTICKSVLPVRDDGVLFTLVLLFLSVQY